MADYGKPKLALPNSTSKPRKLPLKVTGSYRGGEKKNAKTFG